MAEKNPIRLLSKRTDWTKLIQNAINVSNSRQKKYSGTGGGGSAFSISQHRSGDHEEPTTFSSSSRELSVPESSFTTATTTTKLVFDDKDDSYEAEMSNYAKRAAATRTTTLEAIPEVDSSSDEETTQRTSITSSKQSTSVSDLPSSSGNVSTGKRSRAASGETDDIAAFMAVHGRRDSDTRRSQEEVSARTSTSGIGSDGADTTDPSPSSYSFRVSNRRGQTSPRTSLEQVNSARSSTSEVGNGPCSNGSSASPHRRDSRKSSSSSFSSSYGSLLSLSREDSTFNTTLDSMISDHEWVPLGDNAGTVRVPNLNKTVLSSLPIASPRSSSETSTIRRPTVESARSSPSPDSRPKLAKKRSFFSLKRSQTEVSLSDAPKQNSSQALKNKLLNRSKTSVDVPKAKDDTSHYNWGRGRETPDIRRRGGLKISEVIYAPGYSREFMRTEGVLWTPDLGVPWDRKYGVPHPDVVAMGSGWYSDSSESEEEDFKTKSRRFIRRILPRRKDKGKSVDRIPSFTDLRPVREFDGPPADPVQPTEQKTPANLVTASCSDLRSAFKNSRPESPDSQVTAIYGPALSRSRNYSTPNLREASARLEQNQF
ncbi:hypothetical protein BJ508DRAFT_325015 [Ascobolus immersus RN42]|uniref:Uncharacterized protein n=1 Tax=Ascobolus immersus RN42 TaxID=1160509 RepID=A0A3N4I9U8_ASCIM|nr:hypothetical protein BJ508DRAFT_325015 [Ascobolus immersus RN42]